MSWEGASTLDVNSTEIMDAMKLNADGTEQETGVCCRCPQETRHKEDALCTACHGEEPSGCYGDEDVE